MRLSYLLWFTLLTSFLLLVFGYHHLPHLIENSLSGKFKVPVKVGDLEYSYSFADIPFFELKDLEISNPEGSTLPTAFSCNEMVFKSPYTRYLDRQIVIQNLIIINPYFSFEFDSPEQSQGNWNVLMKQLQYSIDKAAPKDKSVLIEKLILHNINAQLVYNSAEKKVESLPFIREIVLSDIRGSGSTVVNNILTIVFEQSLKALLDAYKIKNQITQNEIGILNEP